MDAMELGFVQPHRTRTPFVMVLLVLAAITFSYLGTFCLPDALVSSGVIPHWDVGHDPRPHWMLEGTVLLTAIFMGMAGLARLMNWRQFRRIDAMADA